MNSKTSRMVFVFFCKFIFLFVILNVYWGASPLNAVTYSGFLTKNCRFVAGVVSYVSDQNVILLDTNGRFQTLAREDIQAVSEYNVVELIFPPVRKSLVTAPIYEFRTVGETRSFRGFAYSFVDGMVLILDTQGRVHVVEINKITQLESVSEPDDLRFRKERTVQFEPILSDRCPATKATRSDVTIERLSSQDVQIEVLLNKYRDGYRDLESLAERTRFYARPLLFDQMTRMGIVFGPETLLSKMDFEEGAASKSMPLYFHTSGGSPYRFQTSLVLGKDAWPSLPYLRSSAGGGSYFKSHLIHGEFLLNFDGFAAGSHVFGDFGKIQYSEALKKGPASFAMAQAFNHLTLLGVDYRSFSLSVGNYYPVFLVRGKLGEEIEARSLTPPRSSLVLRGGITTAKSKFSLLFFNTDVSGKGLHETEAIAGGKVSTDDLFFVSSQYIPQNYSLLSRGIRLNIQHDFSERLSMTASALIGDAHYKESAFERSEPAIDQDSEDPATLLPGSQENKVDQTDLQGHFGIRLDTSRWVGLSGRVSYAQHQSRVTGWKNASGEKKAETSYEIILEILL